MVLRTGGAGTSDLIYSTLIGGSEFDYVDGMCIDKTGNVLLTGGTTSPDFPIRPSTGAFQSTMINDYQKAFAMKLQISAGLPTAPRDVGTSAGTNYLDVSWSAPSSDGGSPITGYNVYRRTGTTVDKVLLTTTPLSSTARSYHDIVVSTGTEYVYSIRAVNANGLGDSSIEANVSLTPVQNLQVPGQILDLQATANADSITLHWSAPTNGGSAILGYFVYRIQNGAETLLTDVLMPPSSTSYSDSTAQSGIQYTYRVTAKNNVGESAKSNEAMNQIGLGPTVPGAPTDLRTTPGASNITLRWTPPAYPGTSPITQYRIYVGTTTGQEVAAGNISASSASCLVSGIPLGATRYFQVTAVNSVGESNRSGEVSAATISSPMVPAAPAALTTSIHLGDAVLSWTLPSTDGGSKKSRRSGSSRGLRQMEAMRPSWRMSRTGTSRPMSTPPTPLTRPFTTGSTRSMPTDRALWRLSR